jgi:transposase
VLIKFLKSKNYSYRRIRKVLKKQPDAAVHDAKLKEILQLVALERKNFLKIYFADESGFNETPCVPYGWQDKDEPLTIPSSKGQRCNVFGIMSSDNQLFYDKTTKSIDSDFVINAIDNFVQSPYRAPRSVIFIDNATIHHSEKFKLKITEWQLEGVEIFYLPTYSPHLNRIETLWRKIKYEWLLPEDYESWKKLSNRIQYILDNFGTEFQIDFSQL